MNSGELSNAELSDIQVARANVVSQTKGQYMMAIYSPENVGTILFLSFGTGSSSSSTLRQKGYKFLTTNLSGRMSYDGMIDPRMFIKSEIDDNGNVTAGKIPPVDETLDGNPY